VKILFAVRKGEPDYMEELITEQEERIEKAKKWAIENGFDRLRVATIDEESPPDFTKAIAPAPSPK
jgi:hypothetical protein